MIQPGPVEQLEIFQQLQKDGPFQRFNQAARTDSLIGFKSQESVPNLPSISGECRWTNLHNVRIDNDSTDIWVWVPISEFERKKILFNLKGMPAESHSLPSPVPSNNEIEGCKEKLVVLLKTIYQDEVVPWLDTFVIGDRSLSACESDTLRNTNCPNEEWEVAILFILMMRARAFGPSALWSAMAKSGWKLASICSLKMQGLISDISNTLCDSTRAEIQDFIKTRSKSARMAIEVSNLALQDGTDERLRNMKARLSTLLQLDTDVRTAFGIKEGDACLVVNSWDNFSVQERLQAGMIACHIMKIIIESQHHKELLHLVNKLWSILQDENHNAGSLDLICISVRKLRSEYFRWDFDLCVVEWLASPLDLCMKIQKEKVLQFLDMSKIGNESKLVFLPFCNASDYNKVKSKKMFGDTNEQVIERRMRRKILQAKKSFETIEQLQASQEDENLMGLFVYAAFCKRSSRVIQPQRISLEPNMGICSSINMDVVKACQIFNESDPALQSTITFERSKRLYPAEHLACQLTGQAAGTDSDSRPDMMQSSFDSFSWVSNVYKGSIGVTQVRQDRLCPRLSLMAATDSNMEHVMTRIILNWRMTAAGSGDGTGSQFRRQNVGGSRLSDIPHNMSDYSDQAYEEGEMSAPSCIALGSSAQDIGENHVNDRYRAEINNAIVKCLRDCSVTRYVQVDFEPDQSNLKVNSITYMSILPDTKYSNQKKMQVSQNLVCMYVAHHRTKGRFVNCCCNSFVNNIRKIESIQAIENYELWFFHTSRQNLFPESSVKNFCMHVQVEDKTFFDTFMDDTFYTWDQQRAKMNFESTKKNSFHKYKQSSIAFTMKDGLNTLADDIFQDVRIVQLSATNPIFANPNQPFAASTSVDRKKIFSVDIAGLGENRHALVKVLWRRFTNDANPQNETHEQIICDQCSSRLNSNGYAPCSHIMALFEALNGKELRDVECCPYTHTRVKHRKSKEGGFYDPKLLDTECNPGEERTCFVYNETYTNVQHPMDLKWKNNMLCFGDEISRPLADRKNEILDGKTAVKGEKYSYYEVSVGEILKGEFPPKCPKCCRSCESQKVSSMNVVLYMSDKKVVHASVKYWVCVCRFFVHTDGAEDGFWFLNQHLAVSTQLLWDFLNLQMQGCGMDFSSYCKVCDLGTQSAMRDKRNKFINRNQLSDLYFAFFSRLTIMFNLGCLGCIAEVKGFPKSYDYSEVQAWSKNPPPIARDIPDVGFDGLSRFFAKYILFKKGNAAMKEEGNNSTSMTKRRKFYSEHPFLQYDRSAIKTGGWDVDKSKYVTAAAASQDVRQCAMMIRKGFFALGARMQGVSAEKECYFDYEVSNRIRAEVRELKGLVQSEHSRQHNLVLPLMLADVCSNPTALYNQFNLHKTERLMQYVGKLMKQLAANNSVLTLLKLDAVQPCLKFCDKAESESDWSSVMVEHAGLISCLKSRLGKPGRAAHSLQVLLDYFCLDGTTCPIQNQVNMALCQSLRFIAERVREVFVLYGLNEGNSPHPVRFPEDHFKTWSNEDLKIKESLEPGNPLRDNGAYFFTKNGAKLRELPVEDSRYEEPQPDNDCKKPGFQRDRRAGRAAGKRTVFCVYCVRHGILMGYHIIFSSEGRKDPFFAIYVFKETSPHSTSYDFSCG